MFCSHRYFLINFLVYISRRNCQTVCKNVKDFCFERVIRDRIKNVVTSGSFVPGFLGREQFTPYLMQSKEVPPEYHVELCPHQPAAP